MNVALGTAGVAFGLAACVGGIVVTLVSLKGGKGAAKSRPFVWAALGGNVVAVVAMQLAIHQDDFTVSYVARHSSTRTPFPFDVTTMWSALEGSILLWGLILCGLVAAVTRKFRDRLEDDMVAWALVVLFAVTGFFFALMLGPARVFETFDPPVGFDGPGPNPLLQDHVLVAFHPPMLYLGYVGFTVPFAFAIAALATGRLGEGWLAETRRWTLGAWGFLTAGIVLGAWWAYEVTGWGGYWAWDPIENASLLPWLTATAFLHSVMVQERRGMLRVWNLSLICATFALTILGTFLARSGVIDSVHAFANGTIGPTLLGFFAVVTALCVGLIGWRGEQLRSESSIDTPLSREASFLANNLLFAAFAFVVLIGTVFPLVVEAVNDDRISVGGPFFDRMSMPIGLALLFLMAVAPVLPWRAGTAGVLADRLWWPAWGALGCLVVALVSGSRGAVPLVAFTLGGFAAGSAVRQLVTAVRRAGARGLVGRSNGGMIVHLGTIMIAVAIAASQSYARQGEFTLDVGEQATVGGHTFTYLGSRVVEASNRQEVRARIRIDGGAVYEPASVRYVANGQTVARPSVQVGLLDDRYLGLVRPPVDVDGSIRLRVIIEPLIIWLWIGGTVMGLGTIAAMVPSRSRRRSVLAVEPRGDGDGSSVEPVAAAGRTEARP